MSGNKNLLTTKMETPVGEPSFSIPKIHFSQGKCTQTTGIKMFSSKSVDGSNCSLPRRHFTEVESSQALETKFITSQAIGTRFISSQAIDTQFISSQAVETKLISSKPVTKSALGIEGSLIQKETIYAKYGQTSEISENFNNAVFIKKSDDCLDFNIAQPLQKESLQYPGSKFQSSRIVEEIASRIEKLPFLQKTCPFMKHAKFVKNSEFKVKSEATRKGHNFLGRISYANETSSNFMTSCVLNKDEQIEDSHTINENPFVGKSGNLGTYIRTSKSEQKELYFGNLLSSSGSDKESRISREHFLIKDIVKIAKELLTIEYANSLPAEDSYFENNSLQNDISSKYRQLYSETYPDDYDFAMNLMAYIEFLNDSSWSVTHSYFNDKVKKMVKYLWIGVKYYVDNRTNLPVIDIDTFQQMLVEFTKSWDQRANFILELFLNYCVIMCQIGVRSRKRELREAPIYVICCLRNRIEEIENSRLNHFEFIVEHYAEKLVRSFKL